jgi:hypothetical protein
MLQAMPPTPGHDKHQLAPSSPADRFGGTAPRLVAAHPGINMRFSTRASFVTKS